MSVTTLMPVRQGRLLGWICVLLCAGLCTGGMAAVPLFEVVLDDTAPVK